MKGSVGYPSPGPFGLLSRMSVRLLCVVAFGALSCTGKIAAPPVPVDPLCDAACQAQAVPTDCLSTQRYFNEWAWPNVISTCAACHVAGGRADGTRYILKAATAPGYLASNYEVVREAALLKSGDRPLMLQKSTGQVAHQGGAVLASGSREYAILLETIKQLETPKTCPTEMVPPPVPVTEGLVLMSPYETLRKATLQLAGRPPTAAEIAAIDAGGLPALDGLLTALMNEKAFYERLREIFSDVLLTDAFLWSNRETHGGYLVNNNTFATGVATFDSLADWEWQSTKNGIRTTDALAREPVEYFVHMARLNRPLTEVLTAKYRLLNGYTAKFFKVPYKGVAAVNLDPDTTDPTEFVEVGSVPQVNERSGPGEYAGILTSTSFLARYPNTPTNFNRKRARFVYKYFLNFDIMKIAPRIDADAVDLNANPTRNNPVCTGCHAKIDPFAGALGNWTECGYDDKLHYFTPSEKYATCGDRGWAPATAMYPPGTDLAETASLSDSQRAKGAELLAASIVAKGEFPQAMVNHLVIGILNRPLLRAPTDPAMPGYANLDAAYEAEKKELARLVDLFKAGGMVLKPLVAAIVNSPLFRAKNADMADRLELTGFGGGTMSTPESLDRRIESTLGIPWAFIAPPVQHDQFGPRYLRRISAFKVSYGGVDQTFDGSKVRQRYPSSMSARISERMGLMMSCIATPRDFDLPAASRKLFPLVEKTLAPTGMASAADQAAIITNIQHLHERFWGERLAANDPEILATYDLFTKAHATGRAAIMAGTVRAQLDRPCANDVDLATGAARTPAGTVTDPTYVVRAWQTVIAYMLMDYRFLFEN
jgi:hypothetical protein